MIQHPIFSPSFKVAWRQVEVEKGKTSRDVYHSNRNILWRARNPPASASKYLNLTVVTMIQINITPASMTQLHTWSVSPYFSPVPNSPLCGQRKPDPHPNVLVREKDPFAYHHGGIDL